MQDSLRLGADNLLRGCVNARPGESLLVVCEDPSETYYDKIAPAAVTSAARAAGLSVTQFVAPVVESSDEIPAPLMQAMTQADHTVFFARIGDQMRFAPNAFKNPPVIMYTIDGEMLGSSLGTADFSTFYKIKLCFDQLAASSDEIRITCPDGTDITGTPDKDDCVEEVSARRFPWLVTRPVCASGFSGTIALSRFLTGTGTHRYSPYTLSLEGTVRAQVQNGQVIAFEGSTVDVEMVRSHHKKIADRYGLDPWRVHSWHVGIHPGCAYRRAASEHFERWSGSAFGNPRILHFHACANSPPGEISWNLVDASVEFDGVKVWDNGVIRARRVPGLCDVLDGSNLGTLFANPDRSIGV